jgi:hypothetical protein
MGDKLMKVFARRYFIYGMILSLRSFFAVPKGDTNICLVYNGTSSGLNAHKRHLASPVGKVFNGWNAKELIMGDPHDEQNVYQWKEVQLNLTGSPYYDPSLAWVAKVREDGRVAADLFIYIDDLRLTGPDADECWRASQKATSICNYLGIQDAPRKRREVSRAPGLWAVSMVYTDDSAAGVRILVSIKKWAKAKRLLATLRELVLASEWVDHKVFEKIRVILVYVARTYKPLTPFLVGLHMLIDGWRPGIDDEGWILRQAEVEAIRDSKEEGDEHHQSFINHQSIIHP